MMAHLKRSSNTQLLASKERLIHYPMPLGKNDVRFSLGYEFLYNKLTEAGKASVEGVSKNLSWFLECLLPKDMTKDHGQLSKHPAHCLFKDFVSGYDEAYCTLLQKAVAGIAIDRLGGQPLLLHHTGRGKVFGAKLKCVVDPCFKNEHEQRPLYASERVNECGQLQHPFKVLQTHVPHF